MATMSSYKSSSNGRSTVYVAVPNSDADDAEKLQQEHVMHPKKTRSTVRLILGTVLAFLVLGMIFDDNDSSHDENPDYYYYGKQGRHHHHGKHHHHHHHDDEGWWEHVKKDLGFGPRPAPTKLPGGGRDWLVDVTEGTLVAKHNPSLVLGVDRNAPLVLVPKGSPDQLTFGPPPKDGTEKLPFVSKEGGNVLVQDTMKLPGFRVRVAGLNVDNDDYEQADTTTASKDTVMVSFKDNFIILNDDNDKMVLDVAFWEIMEGSHVNFVRDASWCSKKTFVSGGGRDWIWNQEDGTIATKLNPNLVLGKTLPSMVLVKQEDTKHKIVLDKSAAMDLASGLSVPMVLENGGVVTQRLDRTKEFGPWHFVESAVDTTRVDSTSESPITIQYDGNYVFVNDDNQVLDVSFWNMEPGTVVNFVGGDKPAAVKAKKDVNQKYKSSLRSESRSSSSSSSED